MYSGTNDTSCDLDVEYLPSMCTKRFRQYENYNERIFANFMQITADETVRVRGKYKVRLERYGGTDDNQLLDIYYKENENGPIFVYIHGGYWQMLDRSTAGSFVEPLVEMGYRVLVVDYNLCPQLTLAQLMEQIRNFYKWLNEYSQQTNAKSVCIAGHSAGAHLITTFLQEPLLPINRLNNVFLISGVYDLRELYKLESLNSNNLLSLDDERSAEKLSPMCWKIPNNFSNETCWHLLVGKDESNTFIEQSRQYAKKLQAGGLYVKFLILDYDHFNIVETVPVEGSEINQLLKARLTQVENM